MMTADYSGGSVSVFPIENGQIGERVEQICFEGSGPVEGRQESSHIHQLKVVPGAEGYILASDLGADVIRLLKTGKGEDTASDPGELELTHVEDIECPAGSGPRHMEFSADGRMLYCIAELIARLSEISNGNKRRVQYDVGRKPACTDRKISKYKSTNDA
jgi:6-phosphogluconolactonase